MAQNKIDICSVGASFVMNFEQEVLRIQLTRWPQRSMWRPEVKQLMPSSFGIF